MTTHESDITLGEEYQDTITGFKGTATACYFYLHGCERVQLESWDENRRELSELIFDVPRLVHVPSQQAMTDREQKTGGFKPAPPRRGAR